MARKVIWSYEATCDLDALAEYIRRDSSFYAAAFTQEILDASRALNDFSEKGCIVPEHICSARFGIYEILRYK